MIVITRATLQRARDLVAAGWCQDSFAVNDEDQTVPCNSAAARRYCSMGAVYASLGPDGLVSEMDNPTQHAVGRALAVGLPADWMPMASPFLRVETYNDAVGRTKAEVLAVMDVAAAVAPV